ncbi:MAG: hypothetical protein CUN48_16295, partial [Candidatus Thermofonsia Clade 3 bacterium]
MTAQEGSLSALAASKDGAVVAAGDAGGFVHIWTQGAGAPALSWAAHSGRVNSVALAVDERLLATAGDDGAVHLWRFTEDFSQVAENETIATQKTPVSVVQLGRDGSQLAYASANAVILQRLDAREAPPIRWMTGSAEATALAFSPDGGTLAAGDAQGRIWLWSLEQPARAPRRWNAHVN